MNTTQLFDIFITEFKPCTIAVNKGCKDTENIDCCLISEYSNPSELWDMLTSAIYNANNGCTIFLDTMSPIRPGEMFPYPASISLIASSMAIYADIVTIDLGSSSAVLIKVYNKHIHIDKSVINSLDFSAFNNRIASNLLCHSVNLARPHDISWIRQHLCDNVSGSTDIVFTLASAKSPTNNDELRIALRSIDTYAQGLGDVYLVTDNPPEWVTNVKILNVPDSYTNNKDANLITKILRACDVAELSDKFIYWSDDQVLTSSVNLSELSPVYNPRGIKEFKSATSKWSRRMLNTLNVVKKFGGDVSCNWDSHVPQPIHKQKFKDAMSKVDFISLPGLCINTAYFGLVNEQKKIIQSSVKATYETSGTCTYDMSKMFIGYNDNGFNSGLREALLDKFSKPCKYEKTT